MSGGVCSNGNCEDDDTDDISPTNHDNIPQSALFQEVATINKLNHSLTVHTYTTTQLRIIILSLHPPTPHPL